MSHFECSNLWCWLTCMFLHISLRTSRNLPSNSRTNVRKRKVYSFGHIGFICEDWWENTGVQSKYRAQREEDFQSDFEAPEFRLWLLKSLPSLLNCIPFLPLLEQGLSLCSPVRWIRNSLKSWSLSLLQRHVDFPANGLDDTSLGKGHAELRLQIDYDSVRSSQELPFLFILFHWITESHLSLWLLLS